MRHKYKCKFVQFSDLIRARRVKQIEFCTENYILNLEQDSIISMVLLQN